MSARSVPAELLLAAALTPFCAFGAATIVIVNGNAAGVGFNDPTPAAPVGGNAGATLGQQRLIAFQAAANIWGATVTSSVVISVFATFEPLSCTATAATLGSATALSVFAGFPGAAFPGTWYPVALANKLVGTDLDPDAPDGLLHQDIRARFNSNLGQANCLPGTFFYLGLDNNHGANLDLITVLIHELGHGLGFQTFTDGASGAQLAGFPSVWDRFIVDTTTGKDWTQMTDGERAASAIKPRKVVWNGSNVTTAVPLVLSAGVPRLLVTQPSTVAGTYEVGTASFGPALSSPGVTGEVWPVVDQPDGTGLACNPLGAANANVAGKIAVIDRGVCAFSVKVKNAQIAGAIGVLIVNNAAGSPPPGAGGADPTITIPSVVISLDDGTTLKNSLQFRSRARSGVFANLGVNPTQRAGADPAGRALLFTPNPYQPGSSVSHWDTIAFPNLLMEPAINSDLTHSVTVPQDLTFQLLKDIGWN